MSQRQTRGFALVVIASLLKLLVRPWDSNQASAEQQANARLWSLRAHSVARVCMDRQLVELVGLLKGEQSSALWLKVLSHTMLASLLGRLLVWQSVALLVAA